MEVDNEILIRLQALEVLLIELRKEVDELKSVIELQSDNPYFVRIIKKQIERSTL